LATPHFFFSAPRGVVVVDGEPSVSQMLKHALEMNGYQVWTTSTGPEAIDICQHHSQVIRAVMLDLTFDGAEESRTMQSLREINPNLPCCLLTTNPCLTREILLPDGRLYRVLEKPFRLLDLLQTLDELITSTESS
jgi:CheY-like chemotaxis protein